VTAFVLEVYRPGLDRAGGARIVRTVRRAIAGLDDAAIRYASSTLAPHDEVCYIRLEAPTRNVIEALVARLELSDARVTDLVDLDED
jgi:hypothetical protein